ncbi:MAG: hypothetical protein ACXWQR_11965 [Ktedonobacterales bacterium]
MMLREVAPFDSLFIFLLVLIGLGLLAILAAPILAWIYHKRHHTPMTRRSMVVVALAYVGLGAYVLCMGVALSVRDRVLSHVLAIAGFLAFLAFPFLLMLAFPARPPGAPHVAQMVRMGRLSRG